MFDRPERTTVERDGITWTVSTISPRGWAETVAFAEDGSHRQVEVGGDDHAEAVERFRAAEVLPEHGGRI